MNIPKSTDARRTALTALPPSTGEKVSISATSIPHTIGLPMMATTTLRPGSAKPASDRFLRVGSLVGVFNPLAEFSILPDIDGGRNGGECLRQRTCYTDLAVLVLYSFNSDAKKSVIARDAALNLVGNPLPVGRFSSNQDHGHAGALQSSVDQVPDRGFAFHLGLFP